MEDHNTDDMIEKSHTFNEKHKDAAAFFWTSFVQGNVFFSSVITTVLARDIYDKDWMNFIYDLIIPESFNTDY